MSFSERQVSSLRIVHAIGWYLPESLGGTEVYVRALARRQREAGHDVSVVAPSSSSSEVGTYECDGVPITRFPIPKVPTREQVQGAAELPSTRWFGGWIRASAPDVFHVHTLCTGLGIAEINAARSISAGVVFTNHLPSLGYLCHRGTLLRWGREVCDARVAASTCASCVLQERGMPRPAARLMGLVSSLFRFSDALPPSRIGTALGMVEVIRRERELQGRLLSEVDAFVVLNANASRIAIANGAPPEKVTINSLGVDICQTNEQGRHRASQTLRFGFVGRFATVKGIDVLARAFSRIRRDVAIELHIYGLSNDQDSGRVERTVRNVLKDDERVQFHAAVAQPEIPRILRGIDVLVCPSISFENGPTVALEAMSVGTPVITTSHTGVAEVITDHVNGRLLAPGDVPALQETIMALLADPSIVSRWRSHLPQIRTMDRVASDYLRLYGRVAVRSSPWRVFV